LALALAALALLGAASPARADIAIGGPPPEVLSGAALFNAAASDGSRVVFSSRRRLAREDRDRLLDVYLRAGGRTTLLSPGPAGGGASEPVGFLAATPDARAVLVQNDERLAGAEVSFALLSTDGRRAFFLSAEPLLPEDGDDRGDVYESRDGSLRLVTPGTAGTVRLHAIASDGSRVVVSTDAGLDPADVDGFDDIYSYGPDGAALISSGGLQSCPPLPPQRETCKVVFAAASADAARVFFETEDRLSPLDTDSARDVYRGGTEGVELISTGPGDAQASAASLGAITADGSRAFFVGGGPFAPLAGDTYCALYERRDERTALVSVVRGKPVPVARCAGEEIAISADGSAVVFPAEGGAARDRSANLYRRQRGRTTLVSARARGELGAFLKHLSADGSRVVFLTWRPLVRADRDGGFDLYSGGPGGFTLLTLGPAGGNGAHAGPPGSLIGDVFPQFGGASDDGRRVFFSTRERLLRGDRNGGTDLYERGPAGLHLVSR